MVRWIAIAVMASLVAPAWSAEPKEKPDLASVTKAITEAAQPSAELKKLDPLAGNFNYTCKMWMDPTQPAKESKGTIQRKWVLGNRFLEEKVTGTGFDGTSDFEGMGVVGYDKHQKKFTMGWISNMSSGITTSTGSYDSADNKFTFDKEEFCPIRERKVQMRDVVRIESNDKHVIAMYDLDGGKETRMMEIVATRQK